jgi:hypothetical protein
MNRACFKKDGTFISFQEGGDDRPDLMEERLDALRLNAVLAGYSEDDLDLRWITDGELATIQETLKQPTQDEQDAIDAEKLIQDKIKELAITALKGESKLDMNGKITALGKIKG